jgi:hypothetical protein
MVVAAMMDAVLMPSENRAGVPPYARHWLRSSRLELKLAT